MISKIKDYENIPLIQGEKGPEYKAFKTINKKLKLTLEKIDKSDVMTHDQFNEFVNSPHQELLNFESELEVEKSNYNRNLE